MKEMTPWSGEPSLPEMIDDPIVALLMQRDGITTGQLWSVLNGARRALERRAATEHACQ